MNAASNTKIGCGVNNYHVECKIMDHLIPQQKINKTPPKTLQ